MFQMCSCSMELVFGKLQRNWEGRTLMSFTSLKDILGVFLGANFLIASVNTKIRVNAVSIGFSLT